MPGPPAGSPGSNGGGRGGPRGGRTTARPDARPRYLVELVALPAEAPPARRLARLLKLCLRSFRLEGDLLDFIKTRFSNFWREAGKLRKAYVRPAELEEVRSLCHARRRARAALAGAWDLWRRLAAQVREAEPR